jgi:beta-glucosidase-like glycosyl hydrolase/CubicO group peptidase (beta-lactamase class C family)
MTRLLAALAVAAAASASWTAPPSETPAPAAKATPAPRPPAPSPGPWAKRTLARMTLAEKAGQMVGVRAFGLFRNRRAAERKALLDQVRRLKVGCVVVFESEVESLPSLLNELQDAAAVPLLIAADMERGMSFRIRRGVVPLPYAMAVGATASEEAARFTGQIAAREGRALGIHWAFAPVVDVNNNPGNPVINIRSYGEDPEMVSRLTAAFVRGAREGGLMTTAKHFPGHGDTALDSHMQLVTVSADRPRLDAVELMPFRRVVDAGVDSVMTGHIAVPALDATGTPATLSAPMSTELLRNELGFDGLVVTDAMEMSGVRAAWTGEAAIRAVKAGADFILLPPDPHVAIQSLVRAVKEGQLAEARLDESVLRILAEKERLQLDKKRRVDPAGLAEAVARPEDVAEAMEVARRSITVLKNEGGVLPLRAEEPLKVLHLVMSSDLRNEFIQGIPEDELALRKVSTQTVALGPEVSPETEARVLEIAAGFTHVIASAFVRVGAYRGNADMAESHARFLRALARTGKPVVLVSFGSPYLLRQVPEIPVYVCAYGGPESSQRAAVAALFGEYPVGGKLPVTIPGFFAHGHGLEIPRREMTLRLLRPEEAGLSTEAMSEVDRVIEDAIAARAFPGGVAAVGRDGTLVHLKGYGRLSYDADAAAVDERTIYDLASLTKVVVTTTMAMILVDEGKLDVDKPVSAFIPAFSGGMKDKATVRHLLTHSGGQAGGVTYLYKDLAGKEAYVKHIAGLDLLYEPGTRTVYTDLGEILLGEVLERVAGQDIETFARERIFGPLGMKETMFRPPKELLPRIAPTENDPWRGRVVRGEVHDENAHALGGVAAHAGLFGTAGDLARFAQMMLNGGVLEHRRIVSRETLEKFTTRANLVPDSSRALGWDTPSGTSSAGALFSPRSYGHTGFTGTSMWIDPDRKAFAILLTNRVHPTRENTAIFAVRRAFADAAMRGLGVQ